MRRRFATISLALAAIAVPILFHHMGIDASITLAVLGLLAGIGVTNKIVNYKNEKRMGGIDGPR